MKSKLTGAALMVVLTVVAFGVFWWLWQGSQDVCPLCNRAIHHEARAVIEVDGKTTPVCCIRCAITAAKQQQGKVKLTQVSDFASGRALKPAAAYYVTNTPVVLCDGHKPHVGPEKRTYELVFDRCEPSIFAFIAEQQARGFARSNGGLVRRLEEVLEENGVRP